LFKQFPKNLRALRPLSLLGSVSYDRFDYAVDRFDDALRRNIGIVGKNRESYLLPAIGDGVSGESFDSSQRSCFAVNPPLHRDILEALRELAVDAG
jgi:hypothetical protein